MDFLPITKSVAFCAVKNVKPLSHVYQRATEPSLLKGWFYILSLLQFSGGEVFTQQAVWKQREDKVNVGGGSNKHIFKEGCEIKNEKKICVKGCVWGWTGTCKSLKAFVSSPYHSLWLEHSPSIGFWNGQKFEDRPNLKSLLFLERMLVSFDPDIRVCVWFLRILGLRFFADRLNQCNKKSCIS